MVVLMTVSHVGWSPLARVHEITRADGPVQQANPAPLGLYAMAERLSLATGVMRSPRWAIVHSVPNDATHVQ